jgi:DNA-3-methyladenine glycosylase
MEALHMENLPKEIVPLPQEFYEQSTLELAKAMLGCLLVKETQQGMTAGLL